MMRSPAFNVPLLRGRQSVKLCIQEGFNTCKFVNIDWIESPGSPPPPPLPLLSSPSLLETLLLSLHRILPHFTFAVEVLHLPQCYTYPSATPTPVLHLPQCYTYPSATPTPVLHLPQCYTYPSATSTPVLHLPPCYTYPSATPTPVLHLYPSATPTPVLHLPQCYISTPGCIIACLVAKQDNGVHPHMYTHQ